MQARRSLAVLLGAAGASVSAGAGYLYLGEDAHPNPLPPHNHLRVIQQNTSANAIDDESANESDPNSASKSGRRRPLRAISKKDLGWEQSLARDLACWISSASIYTATKVFYAAAPSSSELLQRVQYKSSPQNSSTSTGTSTTDHHLLLEHGQMRVSESETGADPRDTKKRRTTTTTPTSTSATGLYHSLVGWMQELNPQARDWNANQVIQSSSFSMLLNVVSGIDNLSLREDLAQDMYRAVGLLATNAQCASAIVQRATRYGKHALLNLAQAHEIDPRMGEALHAMVRQNDCQRNCFGPANVLSLVALAAAAVDDETIPDAYSEFALWALAGAVSPSSLTTSYTWRKTLFGDDSSAKTRRKLITNDKLWHVLSTASQSRSHDVQLQVARLVSELSSGGCEKELGLFAAKLKRHLGMVDTLVQWIEADDPALACAALRTIANAASDRGLRQQLVALDAMDSIRARVLHEAKPDPELTAHLLRAVRCLAQPPSRSPSAMTGEIYSLDRDALSFVRDPSDEEHPLHHDDFVQPTSLRMQHQYVDGWIELCTTFLRSDHDHVRSEAALCLEQISTVGSHQDQSVQEWLIAVLDGVLQQVPAAIIAKSTSVRAARSRTRPIVGQRASTDGYGSSHAKALRALAFVVGRNECQEELVRRGGIALLKVLLSSPNKEVQRETARVLANLFTCDDLHVEIAEFASSDERLTTVLDEWTTASDGMLRSLAHRARSNRRYQHNRLQHADESDVKYLDGVHPLHFSTSPAFNSGHQSDRSNQNSDDESVNEYDVDVVFIHGLLGCPFETWVCGDDESTVWAEKWLLDDLQRDGHNPRLLSIGYDSQLLASESTWRTMCFKETSQDVLQKLQAARVGESGRPVVFVTHSLGGVVLKQVLLESTEASSIKTTEADRTDSPRLVDSVNGVVFYGVPHHGSPIAQTIQAFRPRTLGIEQHPVTEHLHGTPHLKMLNDWCASLFEEKAIPAISIGESVPCRLPVIGVDALVVPPASANPGFGEFVCVDNADHIDVCKPRSRQDVRYSLAKNFISKHVSVATEGMMNVE